MTGASRRTESPRQTINESSARDFGGLLREDARLRRAQDSRSELSCYQGLTANPRTSSVSSCVRLAWLHPFHLKSHEKSISDTSVYDDGGSGSTLIKPSVQRSSDRDLRYARALSARSRASGEDGEGKFTGNSEKAGKRDLVGRERGFIPGDTSGNGVTLAGAIESSNGRARIRFVRVCVCVCIFNYGVVSYSNRTRTKISSAISLDLNWARVTSESTAATLPPRKRFINLFSL